MNLVGNLSTVNYRCDACQKGSEAVPVPANMHAVCMDCFKNMASNTSLPPNNEERAFFEFLRPFLETDEEFARIKKAYKAHPEKFFIYKNEEGHYGCIYTRIEYQEQVTNYYIRYIFQDPNLSWSEFHKEFLKSTIRANKFRSSPPSRVLYAEEVMNFNFWEFEDLAGKLGYTIQHAPPYKMWIS